MQKAINDKKIRFRTTPKNTIYGRFQKYWSSMFGADSGFREDLYVNCHHGTEDFFSEKLSNGSDGFYFLIGYAGMGKTTFLKHFFHYSTISSVILKDFCENKNVLIVPFSWDGLSVDKVEDIDIHVRNNIVNAAKIIYGVPYSQFEDSEKAQFVKFCEKTVSTCIRELTNEEEKKPGLSSDEKRTDIFCNEHPVEFASSLLKFVLAKTTNNPIDRVIFIVDDLEKLSYVSTHHIYDMFTKRMDCFRNNTEENLENRPCNFTVVLSIRPHSLRYLRDNTKWEQENANAWNYLVDPSNMCVLEAESPVAEIIKLRLKKAMEATPPQKPEAWKSSLKDLEKIIEEIDKLDKDKTNAIQALCHFNVKASLKVMKDVLSSTVWCTAREFTDSDIVYPMVSEKDYDFTWINLMRTIACGNNIVYNSSPESIGLEMKYDGGDVFIPNIISNSNKELDVLPAIILQYFVFKSKNADGKMQPLQERLSGSGYSITKAQLTDEIVALWDDTTLKDRVGNTVEYLFKNRLLRKNVLSKDDEKGVEKLDDNDFLYLTEKGLYLFNIFSNNSALLEMYREDIVRDYENDMYYEASHSLKASSQYSILYEDLMNLLKEIYDNENTYFSRMRDNPFKHMGMNITKEIFEGVQVSYNKQRETLIKHAPMADINILDEDLNLFRESLEQRKKEMEKSLYGIA